MNFKTDLFRSIISIIESKWSFVSENFNDSRSFDIKCNINIQEIFDLVNKNGAKYTKDEVKYCLAILREAEYISISEGFITGVTQSGFKFIVHTRNNINFIY